MRLYRTKGFAHLYARLARRAAGAIYARRRELLILKRLDRPPARPLPEHPFRLDRITGVYGALAIAW